MNKLTSIIQVETIGVNKVIVLIILLSTCVRIFLATQLELGNDEVYYWTYALYPDWSHFDHPPMVGILAQASSLNLYFKDDFFLRLGSILLSVGSTWIIYLIGKKIKNERTGVFAALLFTGSIYCSIISGFSLSPDAPLVFFWLIALHLALKFLPQVVVTNQNRLQILLFGVMTGLAMLSKYQGVFLWVGVLLFVSIYNWKWFKEPSLYLSGFISVLIFSPVIYWNVKNNFMSFSFHSERVTPTLGFNLEYFVREMFGEMAYNNPINYILIIISLIAIYKKRYFIASDYVRVLLLMAIPLWFVFTAFSLFRSTLPHWSGPAFLSLILIAAAYESSGDKKILVWIRLSPILLVILLGTGLYLINYSPWQFGKKSSSENLGEDDFTQDLYGWDQIGTAFKTVSKREEKSGQMQAGSGIITYRWFPGAHLDFYVAQPTNRSLFVIGPVKDIHKYLWINNSRGGLIEGSSYYHIAVSNNFRDPKELFKELFKSIELTDSVEVKRDGQPVRYAFFYLLKNYHGNYSPISLR